ncbi:PTPRS-like protein [Mya arenaria]|uniref:PTPRS-like protein n=1 Tax=Mya arenaria TaxID=6604 RepID=A0ABY7F1Q5_MYAAR|nr:PTPRS-like protein [Mya arenaria]
MRQNRPNMVQTAEQYEFLHLALVHTLILDCEQIPGKQFQDYMIETSKGDLIRQFEVTEGDEYRLRLYLGIRHEDSDYVNAVFVHAFQAKRKYIVSQSPMPNTSEGGKSTSRHFEFTDWNQTGNAPRSPAYYVTFLGDVKMSSSNGPVLVHCRDGGSRSGLFCVMAFLLEKMEEEHEVNVVNAVRKVKAMRPNAVPTQLAM